MFLFLAELTEWAWLAIAVLSVAVIFGIETESGPGTFILLLLGLAGVWCAQTAFAIPTFAEVVHWFGSYWLTLLVYAGYYVGIGVLWSVAKWWSYNREMRDQFKTQEPDIQKDWKKTGPEGYYHSAKGYLKTYADFVLYKYNFPPRLTRNKARILTWMSYWPWSAAWTVLNDPIRRLFNWLYEQLGGVYNAITNHVFAGVIREPTES